MSPFVEWNSLLLTHFFPPSAEGEETWLHATRTELDSIGLRLGGAEGLIAAIEEGAPWLSGYGTVADAAGRLVRQRGAARRSPEYVDPGEVDSTYVDARAPAYLPYLALWVFASSDAADGFYARVAHLSGRPFPGNDATVRAEMIGAWQDLEQWSRDCDGRFGIFAVRVLGGHRFVGMPRSQCLVSPKDKLGLPRLFLECGLRPRQHLSSQLFGQLAARATQAYYLSTGLREAFADPDYKEPLQHMVESVMESWDGTAPRIGPRPGAGPARNGGGHDDAELDAVALVLRPGATVTADWDIHWRIPAVVGAGTVDLFAGGGQWQAALEEAGTHASTRSAGSQDVARRLVAQAGTADVDFTATFVEGGDENGQCLRQLVLPMRRIRVLAWDVPDSALGQELIERGVPLSGPCFLLYADDQANILTRHLGASLARWEPFHSTGLPLGWSLGGIHNCQLLSPEQREMLAGGHGVTSGIARIHLVGGRPLLRGGSRTFAFYDLPIVELEGPDDASIEADGLDLKDLRGEMGLQGAARMPRTGNGFPPPRGSGIRRFAVQVVDDRRASFQIRAVHNGQTVATTRLKVSVSGGMGSFSSRAIGVGPLGQVAVSGPALLGVVRDAQGHPVAGTPPVAIRAAGHRVWALCLSPAEQRTLVESVPARFLDSLAQLGSMAFGAARNQILRLAHGAGAAIQPALLLLDLRGRGHLEIEADAEGHLVRIHAVPPLLYSLPLQYEGRPVRGIGGTLRLQQWQELGEGLAGKLWMESGPPESLPVLRLAAQSEDDLAAFIDLVGMEDVRHPASAVAAWASGIHEARETLGAWGWAGLATEFRYLQRFQPARAEFVARDVPRLDVDPPVMASLYRFEDPVVQGLQVYVLGIARPDGQRQYSFMHDSRWGVWLALSAFAEFARDSYGIQDAVPWPIHYAASDGTLWLPARLRPPFVIERALLLCSASSPFTSTVAPGSVSPVYAQMAGGIWLGYRWVPEEIAGKVAALLGAALAPL
ncbi:MAG: hypothetical protein FJ246_10660 [Nitrospira sp.]|nr:hypothetical protein [Nitrospira sp.]